MRLAQDERQLDFGSRTFEGVVLRKCMRGRTPWSGFGHEITMDVFVVANLPITSSFVIILPNTGDTRPLHRFNLLESIPKAHRTFFTSFPHTYHGHFTIISNSCSISPRALSTSIHPNAPSPHLFLHPPSIHTLRRFKPPFMAAPIQELPSWLSCSTSVLTNDTGPRRRRMPTLNCL